jgi:hypothetical protein
MSLLALRPMRRKVIVSAWRRILSDGETNFSLVTYVFQFTLHPVCHFRYLYFAAATRAIYRSDLEVRAERCLSVPSLSFVGELCGGAELHCLEHESSRIQKRKRAAHGICLTICEPAGRRRIS